MSGEPASVVVVTCARVGCGRTFPRKGKRRYCSGRCQVGGWRDDHPTLTPLIEAGDYQAFREAEASQDGRTTVYALRAAGFLRYLECGYLDHPAMNADGRPMSARVTAAGWVAFRRVKAERAAAERA